MENRKRRFFQIHLSTAIVLMVAAAALLGANLFPKRMLWVDSLGTLNVVGQQWYGWPILCCKGWEELAGVSASYGKDFELIYPAVIPAAPVREYDFYKDALLINFLVAVAILLGAGALAEWFVRRRAISSKG